MGYKVLILEKAVKVEIRGIKVGQFKGKGYNASPFETITIGHFRLFHKSGVAFSCSPSSAKVTADINLSNTPP
ncbi:MAG: hypothetical protein HY754_10385 [Nitrospirae bacterium]|nr:hypothetical protein [Nitrospirota bacterium]